jgi:hypothetical protein
MGKTSIKIFSFLLIIFYIQLVSGQNPVAKISVKFGKNQIQTGPVFISLERLSDNLPLPPLRLEKITDRKNIPLPIQIETGTPPVLWWLISNDQNEANEQLFELWIGNQIQSNHVKLQMDGTGLVISDGKTKALRYNYGLIPPPDSSNIFFSRSGFIHPIWTPQGKVLTRIHPSDHIHHLGFWNPWTKTEFEGREVDFWNIGDGQGTVRFVRFESLQSGPVYASFKALQEHVDLTAPGGEKVALNEIWDIKVWNTVPINNKFLIWDFTSIQKCASTSSLLIKKYRYGGFGFRGTSDWDINNSNFLTSEGKTRENGNGTRSRWCNVFGQTDEGHAGILFLSHPQNYEHPEPVRIWPQGDIFFGFCPVVYSDLEIKSGQTYQQQYRILTYDNKMSMEEAEKF